MGCYEREQAAIAAGTGKRGDAARAYFAELDAKTSEEASCLTHRPDYAKTLFEGKGRRSKKREAKLLETLREEIDALAETASGKVFWDKPLREERRG